MIDTDYTDALVGKLVYCPIHEAFLEVGTAYDGEDKYEYDPRYGREININHVGQNRNNSTSITFESDLRKAVIVPDAFPRELAIKYNRLKMSNDEASTEMAHILGHFEMPVIPS